MVEAVPDAHAFEQACTLQRDEVYRYVRSILGGPADAEDAGQTAFLSAHRVDARVAAAAECATG